MLTLPELCVAQVTDGVAVLFSADGSGTGRRGDDGDNGLNRKTLSAHSEASNFGRRRNGETAAVADGTGPFPRLQSPYNGVRSQHSSSSSAASARSRRITNIPLRRRRRQTVLFRR